MHRQPAGGIWKHTFGTLGGMCLKRVVNIDEAAGCDTRGGSGRTQGPRGVSLLGHQLVSACV